MVWLVVPEVVELVVSEVATGAVVSSRVVGGIEAVEVVVDVVFVVVSVVEVENVVVVKVEVNVVVPSINTQVVSSIQARYSLDPSTFSRMQDACLAPEVEVSMQSASTVEYAGQEQVLSSTMTTLASWYDPQSELLSHAVRTTSQSLTNKCSYVAFQRLVTNESQTPDIH